jgi:hypothetical protein
MGCQSIATARSCKKRKSGQNRKAARFWCSTRGKEIGPITSIRRSVLSKRDESLDTPNQQTGNSMQPLFNIKRCNYSKKTRNSNSVSPCADKVHGAWVVGPARSLDDQQRSGSRPHQNATRAGGKQPLGIRCVRKTTDLLFCPSQSK